MTPRLGDRDVAIAVSKLMFTAIPHCNCHPRLSSHTKSQGQPITIKPHLILQTNVTGNATFSRNITIQIYLTPNSRTSSDILSEEGEDGILRVHRICPDESDCELFLSSVKYFLLELAGTLAGLSWGAWSTLVFVINQIES
ncbi:uncharacterized protein LOC124369413 [Homalodisca vitripennis]|uniref:uncharacterized protein LOC124369413 n=1 Tax=Homalodisca vitripennis TaxID=197043 RepID=UPI001EEBE8BB|nr:uncharacterized protein LOC124369413 [Homalodisca vitripennis]